MADIAHIAGLVAAGEHPSPVPYADFVTTTTHKTLRGPRGRHDHVPREVSRRPWTRSSFPASRAGAGARHRGQGRGVQGGPGAVFRDYQRQVRFNAKALAQRLSGDGFRIVSGGTETT